MALKEKYGNEVSFIIVDVDDHIEGRKLMEKYSVRVIPAFFYIDRNGNVVGEDIGFSPFEEKERRILLDLLAE